MAVTIPTTSLQERAETDAEQPIDPEPACYTCYDTGWTHRRYVCSECSAGRARFLTIYRNLTDPAQRSHAHQQIRETLYSDALDAELPPTVRLASLR